MFSNEDFFRSSVEELLDPDLPFVRTSNGRGSLSNFPSAFDIETSSFEDGMGKHAAMYAFTFGINGRSILGRTWEEFLSLLSRLKSFYSLGPDKRLVVFVHNLAFEFQFLRKRLVWEEVFSNDERTPIYARTVDGIEFRCSYLLSGYSLAYLGDHILRKYPVRKMVGDLDYSKVRFAETPLTPKEKRYILHDGMVVMSYVQELLENEGGMDKIPLTKTGFVRKYCRQQCFFGGSKSHDGSTTKDYERYKSLMKELVVSAPEYVELKEAFQGGFTHANRFYVKDLLHKVTSFDFCSSYPSVMVLDYFPMSAAETVPETMWTKKGMEMLMRNYCVLFRLSADHLRKRDDHHQDSPISSYKCRNLVRPVLDNGRLLAADHFETTMTELDYDVYSRFYAWDNEIFSDVKIYRRGRLPRPFVLSILKLYKAKTELKGVEGRETEYQNSKEKLNAAYGMSVTDVAKPEILYDNEKGWTSDTFSLEDAIGKYDSSKNRFLFYPWGVWVTAHARHNLFSGIEACGMDYVYSDTDSIKILHGEKHQDYIDSYNKRITGKIESASRALNLPEEYFRPKTVQGKVKTIGVWEHDATYSRFKTLGAKRYMDTVERKTSLTVSGVDKRTAIPYLRKMAWRKKSSVYDLFDEGLYLPAGASGKRCHTYIDFAEEGDTKDYLGVVRHWSELSSVHLAESDYSLSLAPDFEDLVLHAFKSNDWALMQYRHGLKGEGPNGLTKKES